MCHNELCAQNIDNIQLLTHTGGPMQLLQEKENLHFDSLQLLQINSYSLQGIRGQATAPSHLLVHVIWKLVWIMTLDTSNAHEV